MLMTLAASGRNAPSPAILTPADAPPSPTVAVETRFGTVAVGREAILDMPSGILGFDGHSRFALVDLPDGRLGQFRLLQSLHDPDVSFIVMPFDTGSGLIDEADLDEARRAAGAAADACFLLIVTIRKEEGTVRMTVNLRAPIVVDAARRVARQCVLSNNRYSIRHSL